MRTRGVFSNAATLMRTVVRSILYKITGINSIRSAINPVTYLDELFFRVMCHRSRQYVLSGKFKGMYLERATSGSEYKPKLLGTYEAELNASFSLLCKPNYVVLDIGSDDGYYAIGMTRMGFVQQAIAIESDPLRCVRLQRNVDRNGVQDRVSILCRKLEDGRQLIELVNKISAPTVIKCDIEGGEYRLLDQSSLSAMASRGVNLIVETHLSQSLESQLMTRMDAAGFITQVVDRSNHELAHTEVRDKINRFLCRIFADRWSNEARPPFNRWIIARSNRS